ncbi:MAG: class I SAM-dependent methyltransferase [Kiritimatiellae bacterium]|jgi:hypothetical protein|nr:class I SAM-dependent methyltransferase [Kiritimatiellia bacterium]
MKRLIKILRLLKNQRSFRAALSTQLVFFKEGESYALGGLTTEEERQIVQLVKAAGRHTGPIIEIGTLFGLTTSLMAAVADKSQRVISVDNFCWNPVGLTPAMHEYFTRKILRTELESYRVELVVSGSEEFRSCYRGEIPAMVFCDADHSYSAVKEEIQWAKVLGVPLICGHDYRNNRFGVTQAVDEEFPEGVEFSGVALRLVKVQLLVHVQS